MSWVEFASVFVLLLGVVLATFVASAVTNMLINSIFGR